MAGFIREELVGMAGVFLLLTGSVLCQLALGLSYGKLLQEAENMATTTNRLLKQCKMKFINCYQLNGVANIPVFVEKFLNRLQFGRLTMTGIRHLSGQLVMLSVFLCGWGACRGIIAGKTLGQILPWYIFAIGGLYLYFAVSGLVDVQGKRQSLKVELVDYLENHLVASLSRLEEDKRRIEPPPEPAGKESPRRSMAQTDEESPRRGMAQAGEVGDYVLFSKEEPILEDVQMSKENGAYAAGPDRESDASAAREEAAELEAILREFSA